MSRTLRFDSKGNDITPMCEIADGIVLDDGCGECAMKNDCPGYYDGCFEAVNGANCEIEKIIKVLSQERACVARQSGAGCNRDCGCCDLVLDDKTVLQAYDAAIEKLRAMN